MAARVCYPSLLSRRSPDPVNGITKRMQGIQIHASFTNPPEFPDGFNSVPYRPFNLVKPGTNYTRDNPFQSASRPSFDTPQPQPPPPRNLKTKPRLPKGRSSLPAELPGPSSAGILPEAQKSESTPSLPTAVVARKTRRASEPVQRSTPSRTARCSGVTQAGRRCNRHVTMTLPFASHADRSEEVEVYCHDHQRIILTPPGYYSKTRPELAMIEYAIWISKDLSEETKATLRSEMEKTISKDDKEGELYCFEILDPSTPEYVHFKIGRSCNLHKRLDTWSRQCSSRTQIPRGRYPECSDGSLLRGKLSVGEYVKFSHRFERLVHIELADLSTNEQYLEQEWHRPTGLTSAVGTAVSPTGKGKNKVLERMMREECEDCGKVHREIFTFKKMTGEFENQEFQRVVWPVILKWGTFVESCL